MSRREQAALRALARRKRAQTVAWAVVAVVCTALALAMLVLMLTGGWR